MRKIVLGVCATVLVTAAAPAAVAHPTYDYRGGCEITALDDGTNGAQTVWTGIATAVFTATDTNGVSAPTAAIDGACVAYFPSWGGGTAPHTILVASGTGTATNSELVTFMLDPDESVVLCEEVTVAGEYHERCHTEVLDPTTNPAYGAIVLHDDGTGPLVVSGFPPGWTCVPDLSGMPTALSGTCTPPATPQFHCPVMAVVASALSGSVGGRADCGGPTADTGLVSPAGSAYGDLGPVTAVTCVAYNPNGLVAPYFVACADPGAPVARPHLKPVG